MQLAARNLVAATCRQCNGDLGSKARARVTGRARGGNGARLSAYHPACLVPPGLPPTARPPMSTSLTAPDEAWLAEAACVAPDEGPVAVIVVNPCCNHAVLIRTRTGQWRVATLDKFRRAGFLPVCSGRPAESHLWAWSCVVYPAFDPQRPLPEKGFFRLELPLQPILGY